MTVEQTTGSLSIGLHNGDIQAAIEVHRKTPNTWRPAFCFRAYLNPLCETDVRYLPPEPAPTSSPQ